MALTGDTNEAKIWNYLKSKGLNDFGCASLMGNLYSESGLNPKNLQNTGNKKLGMTDEEYTDAVDNGTYVNFVKDNIGYGLAQWTYWTRKQNLLDFIVSKNKSIGDLEMQLEFLYKELSEDYKSVLSILKNATSVLEASNAVLLKFEKPADQSTSVQKKRAVYGQVYYDKYAKKEEKKGGKVMAKYIAHASIDEHGKISGGSAGDQTTKEVCIRTWYNKPWNYVLRIKNEKVRIQFANNMIDLAKGNYVGYDQYQRNTLLTQAKKADFDFSKITTKCECDCSSAITICILGAIYKILGMAEYEKAYKILVVGGNCMTTSTLRNGLKKLNMITVYSSSAYITDTSKATFGDIYLKEGSHVVCYIDDGNKVEATTSSTSSNKTSSSKSTSTKTNKIKEWQEAAIKDGFKFPKYGADGDWGSECEAVAKKAVCKKYLTYKYKNLTKIVQKAVGVETDGKFGINTKNALIAYQEKNKLPADGKCGLKTWKCILGIK